MAYYKYDPHVHTSEVSMCGRVTAADMVRQYKTAGYQGIIITDHYYDDKTINATYENWEQKIDCFLKGYRAAFYEGKNSNLDVLLGMEIRFNSDINDYLIFGIDEDFLYNHELLNRYTLESFRSLTKGTGVMIYQAHPFRTGMIPASPELIDGIEVFNGNPRHRSNNNMAYTYAVENKLYMISGSDAHQLEDIGIGGIGLYERVSTSGELVALINEGKPLDLIQRTQI